MLIELLALIAGLIIGTFTGITPGIHINLVAALMTSSAPLLLTHLSPVSLAIFLFSVAITHTFVDAIPSTLLGAPNPDTAELILPAQQMVIDGEGYEAVRLATMGAQMGLAIGTLALPLIMLVFPIIYEPITPYIGWLLLAVCLYFIITEEDNNKRFWAAIIFIFSGILGSLVLSFPNLQRPLLPLLSGLFGVSALLLGIIDGVVMFPQRIGEPEHLGFMTWARTLIASICAGAIASLLPGLGTSQATMAAKAVLPKKEPHAFMVAVGGINTLNYLFSLATWAVLDKARNGAVVALKEFVSADILMILVVSGLIVAGLATILTLGLARITIEVMNRVPYQAVSWAVLILLVLLTTIISGWRGFIILIISTAVGMLPQLLGVRKSVAMGCLVIPVVFFFLT